MNVKHKLLGNNMDRMPGFAFRFMSAMFFMREFFGNPDKKLNKIGIKDGDSIIDYGCGPGIFIRKASALAGPHGTVYAVDVHELAIAAINKRKSKYKLNNVKPVIAKNYKCELKDQIADTIYAFDMFHMVKEPALFLHELYRLIKKTGRLIIEDGHQPRKLSKQKIVESKLWNVIEEKKEWLVCTPL